MRRTALASLVILAGCAGTAQNVVDSGHRYDFGSGVRAYEPIVVALTSPSAYGAQMAVYVDSGLGARAEADWIERLRRGCVDVSVPVVPAVPHSAPAGQPPG